MTVAELIAALQAFPGDMHVITNYDGRPFSVGPPRIVSITEEFEYFWDEDKWDPALNFVEITEDYNTTFPPAAP